MGLLLLGLLWAPVGATEIPTVRAPVDRGSLPRSTLYRVVDSFEGYSYLGVKDVDTSPNPLGCSQDFVTYWSYYPEGSRGLRSGFARPNGSPYATVTILLDGNTFCSSFPPIQEFDLKIGNRIWRVSGDTFAVDSNGRSGNSGILGSMSMGNGVMLPYEVYQQVFSGPQTKSKNIFLLPPDFIEALIKAPIQNLSARIYHPNEGISQFQIGAKTVAAWKDLFQNYKRPPEPGKINTPEG